MANRALLTVLCLLVPSCQHVRIETRPEGAVLREWADCQALLGGRHDISVAGVVRTADGTPLAGAIVFFEDVARTKTEIGVWQPLPPTDSPEGVKRSDARGLFFFSRERANGIQGVSFLGAMAHGYRPASLSWTAKQNTCVEFILSN